MSDDKYYIKKWSRELKEKYPGVSTSIIKDMCQLYLNDTKKFKQITEEIKREEIKNEEKNISINKNDNTTKSKND